MWACAMRWDGKEKICIHLERFACLLNKIYAFCRHADDSDKKLMETTKNVLPRLIGQRMHRAHNLQPRAS
jgi:hypothetical protein